MCGVIDRPILNSCSFVKNFLDKENSWRLFYAKAFGGDGCPSELEGVGKRTVEQCRGLPLSIVVIGGYLSRSSREECFENGFSKLESLTCKFSSEEPVTSDSPQLLEFPSSLVELCLIKCCLGWEDLTAIGSLLCLQVLKLGYSIKGNEWSPIKGEFEQLKHLEIWGWNDLIEWNAEWYHFPVLESLSLKGLTELSEIPLDIGNIPTLEHIKLDECSVSAAISAVRIVEEQSSCGNEDFQLQVCFRNEENCRSFREMVEEEGLNINHLRLVTM